jgi:transposase-like protein
MLVQRRRDKRAALRLMRKLLRKQDGLSEGYRY